MIELIAYYALLAAFAAFMGYLIIDSIAAAKLMKELSKELQNYVDKRRNDAGSKEV